MSTGEFKFIFEILNKKLSFAGGPEEGVRATYIVKRLLRKNVWVFNGSRLRHFFEVYCFVFFNNLY